MIERDAEDTNENYFEPNRELRNYLQERLKVSKEMDEIDAREGEYNDRIDRQNKSLGSRKVGILDKHVFPAMANLSYFFREISEHHELQESFENDIKDLLGVRRYNPRPHNYGFVFSNLIASILLVKPLEDKVKDEVKDEDTTKSKKQKHSKSKSKIKTKRREDDFRLRLIQILQEILYLGLYESLPEILKDQKISNMLSEDMGRAAAWTRMLAYPVKDEYDLRDEKRYKKDIENKSPHRTFPFIRLE